MRSYWVTKNAALQVLLSSVAADLLIQARDQRRRPAMGLGQ
jgi:hypothetical protein